MTEPVPGTLEAGARFGPYHLLGILGEGGGGQVWEADDARTGRRVALKVLTELNAESPEAWARFEREGRLAASVSHPSCVYVFGAEEVGGRPSISMELMRGGTLKDLLKQGPVQVEDAVTHILDVIDGLEAAQRVGIVHRDVKPSNCFLDEHRERTKVGDFGVSRTLEVPSDLSLTGAFIGTPFYASPEQVRGEDLDFRSDLYSVGATLYELLTGRPPVSGSALAVAAQILGDTPAPPSSLSPSVPKALDRVVMRLLAKDPDRRFGSYAALRKALTPFTPGVLTAGGLGKRVVAYFLDTIALFPLGVLAIPAMPLLLDERPAVRIVAALIGFVPRFLYYWLTEYRWGRTLGKWIMGLSVRSVSDAPLTLRQAALRAGGYVTLIAIFTIAANLLFGPESPAAFLVLLWVPVMASTMRRRNGFAGVHDILSGSRVVTIRRGSTFRAPNRPRAPLPETGSAPERFGPYQVEGSLWSDDGEGLLLARDEDLHRTVWIHYYRDPGAAPSIEALRQLRPGRLPWLQGSRSDTPVWDAYGQPTGIGLREWVEQEGPVGWGAARQILHGLATELAEPRDGDEAGLVPERVWVEETGQPKLLDFPVSPPRFERPESAESVSPEIAFLKEVATYTLEGGGLGPRDRPRGPRAPLPGHARPVLEGLFSDAPPGLDDLAADLQDVMDRPARVSRARRFSAITAGASPALMMSIPLILLSVFLALRPGIVDVFRAGDMVDEHVSADPLERRSPEHAAREVVLAELHYTAQEREGFVASIRSFLESQPDSAVVEWDRGMAVIDSVAATRPRPTEAELRAARDVVSGDVPNPALLFATLPTFFFSFLGMAAVVLALLFRGGPVLRAVGIEVQTGDGSRAGRIRCMARTAVAWSPFILWFLFTVPGPGGRVGMTWGPVLLVVGLVGVALSLRNPQRGPHDWVAGTHLVPR